MSRIFTALSAACLVTAFTIAALAPAGLTLADGLLRFDPGLLASLQRRVLPVSAWGWHMIVVPFLNRPAWLPPLMLSVVCGGVALTVARSIGVMPRRPRL